MRLNLSPVYEIKYHLNGIFTSEMGFYGVEGNDYALTVILILL